MDALLFISSHGKVASPDGNVVGLRRPGSPLQEVTGGHRLYIDARSGMTAARAADVAEGGRVRYLHDRHCDVIDIAFGGNDWRPSGTSLRKQARQTVDSLLRIHHALQPFAHKVVILPVFPRPAGGQAYKSYQRRVIEIMQRDHPQCLAPLMRCLYKGRNPLMLHVSKM